MRSDADPTRLVVGLTVSRQARSSSRSDSAWAASDWIGGRAALAFLAIAITQRSALGKAFSRPVNGVSTLVWWLR